MSFRLTTNFPAVTYETQAQMLYHWLVFCNQFTSVEVNGVWTNLLTGNNGIITTVQPSRFYTVTATFLPGHVNKWLAVRDAANPQNNTVAVITAVISTTEVQLNAPVTNFTVDSTGVSFEIIDPLNPPAAGDYFVIQGPVTQPWQARFIVRSVAPLCVGVELGPIGGWDPGTVAWVLPVSFEYDLFTTVAQTFSSCDPEAGWLFVWAEQTGGVGSNRVGIWLGDVSPFHAPTTVGVPKDNSYALIFGTAGASVPNNFSRDTTVPSNFCVGEGMSADGIMIPAYLMQKRFLATTNDDQSIVATVNPRSAQADSYDFVAYHKAPNAAVRGRVPGIRLLNDNLINRTLISAGGTYVIGTGYGATWNGSTPV